jgi:hypothetical protein
MTTFENIISMFIVFVSCAMVYDFFVYLKHVMKLMIYDAWYIIFEEFTKEYTDYIVFINPDGTKYVGKI